MKESILSIAALAASWALAGTYTHTTYTGSDTNLKTLAVVTDGKFVLGTGDYSLTAEANGKLCAMAKELTTSTLNKVLLTASEKMKNGYDRADN